MSEKLHFTKTPKRIVEIILPNWAHPGLCHNLSAIASLLSWCYLQDYYPILVDKDWLYGRWTDLFLPFWDEEENARIASLGLPKITINTANRNDYLYGLQNLVHFSVQKNYPYFHKHIFQVQEKVLNSIDVDWTIDCAIHLRISEQEPNKEAILNDLIEKLKVHVNHLQPKNLFIMTDNKQNVARLKKEFSMEILTLCPDYYDNIPQHIRSSKDFMLMLKEIDIAKNAQYFLGTAMSQVSECIDLCREGKNVFYIQDIGGLKDETK